MTTRCRAVAHFALALGLASGALFASTSRFVPEDAKVTQLLREYLAEMTELRDYGRLRRLAFLTGMKSDTGVLTCQYRGELEHGAYIFNLEMTKDHRLAALTFASMPSRQLDSPRLQKLLRARAMVA